MYLKLCDSWQHLCILLLNEETNNNYLLCYYIENSFTSGLSKYANLRMGLHGEYSSTASKPLIKFLYAIILMIFLNEDGFYDSPTHLLADVQTLVA
uniref:Uncharacterized protein n=1 Tax=Glossina pallidipes TaxID=7398 RepID=A0A1A9ZRN0_GLOPL